MSHVLQNARLYNRFIFLRIFFEYKLRGRFACLPLAGMLCKNSMEQLYFLGLALVVLFLGFAVVFTEGVWVVFVVACELTVDVVVAVAVVDRPLLDGVVAIGEGAFFSLKPPAATRTQ